MILDEDDIYAQNNVFSTLYKEAESHNLQIVGFSLMFYKKPLKKLKFMHYYETPILYQPNITNRMYYHISNKKIVRITYLTSTYLLKTDLMVKTIKQIDKQYYNIRMNYYDDYILFFLLTRNAYNFKQLKKIFYVVLIWPTHNKKILFREVQKQKEKKNLKCLCAINYITFLLMNTNNTIRDKQIASYELERLYLNYYCGNNSYIKQKGINVCNLFLRNKYIEDSMKKK
jgi:hypothetical protein